MVEIAFIIYITTLLLYITTNIAGFIYYFRGGSIYVLISTLVLMPIIMVVLSIISFTKDLKSISKLNKLISKPYILKHRLKYRDFIFRNPYHIPLQILNDEDVVLVDTSLSDFEWKWRKVKEDEGVTKEIKRNLNIRGQNYLKPIKDIVLETTWEELKFYVEDHLCYCFDYLLYVTDEDEGECPADCPEANYRNKGIEIIKEIFEEMQELSKTTEQESAKGKVINFKNGVIRPRIIGLSIQDIVGAKLNNTSFHCLGEGETVDFLARLLCKYYDVKASKVGAA